MARTVGQPSKTGVIWVAVTYTLIITGQLFTISGTPGSHIVSWILIGCTVLLFITVVASYLRKTRGRGSPPD
jgi:hypothetical protein